MFINYSHVKNEGDCFRLDDEPIKRTKGAVLLLSRRFSFFTVVLHADGSDGVTADEID